MAQPASAVETASALYRQGDWVGAWNSSVHGLRQAPSDTALLNVLGLTAIRLGRLDQAIQCFQQILQFKEDAGAAANLGNCLHRLERRDEAVAAYGRALAASPHEALLHANLGGILVDMGRGEEGMAACRRAIALDPVNSVALKNVAVFWNQREQHREAVRPLERLLRLDPRDGDAVNLLALSYHRTGRPVDAERLYRQALALAPAHEEAWNNLAALFYQNSRPIGAAATYRRLLTLNPDNFLAHNNLGVAYNKVGQSTAAIGHLRRAVGLQPGSSEAWLNLGNALKDAARLDEASRAYGRSRDIDGDPRGVHLLLLNSLADLSPQALFAAHRQWAARHADPLEPPVRPARPPLAGRRLRLGYVSPDLWTHSVSYFFRPLLEAHDRECFEVFVYSDCRTPDDMTAKLRASTEHWRHTVGLSDDELCQLIAQDGIDVLVDLAGHTADNRLACFARRPAPVQVTWLGYANTTGMRAMDWRVTDILADPPGEADGLASETLLRLPGGFLCYRPPDDAPDPGAGSAANGGAPVFASFNSPAKLTEPVIALWARLLGAVPEARLVLKSRALDDPGVVRFLRDRFAAGGVAPDRVDLLSFKGNSAEHLAVYRDVDIGLDPFPYNGTTTTCEALWMGVPVITRLGRTHAGRVGTSLLGHLGLTDLIARDDDDYVRIAAALARETDRLRCLRAGLRQRLRGSVLCDAPQFARRFEAAMLEAAVAGELFHR